VKTEGAIIAANLGGGFLGGFLIGYAIKKVAKLVGLVFGLFLGGLAYLEHQSIIKIKWDQLHIMTQEAMDTIGDVTQDGVPGVVSQLCLENWGIPMTGGMSAGFAIGIMKG
jgi:uncharacterized membrane protein (Fun14 family)